MHGAEAERKNADKGDPSMSANTTAAPLIGPRDRESFFEAQRPQRPRNVAAFSGVRFSCHRNGYSTGPYHHAIVVRGRVAHRRHCQYLGTVAGEFLAA